MKNTIYADNAATTRLDEDVLAGMLPYLSDSYGNASSKYSLGASSRKAVNQARQKFAQFFHAKEDEIFFTSGGTESDNWAIKGIASALRGKGNHIITSSIEHLAVINSCAALQKQGYKVSYLPVDNTGMISLVDLEQAISPETILISVMMANNEVGMIQPLQEITKIAKKHDIFVHTDAVQAIGHVDIEVERVKVDAISISAHKFYGPKGVGVLYLRSETPISPLLDGGHQEHNLRAGTENVAGIVGAGIAVEKYSSESAAINELLFDLSKKTINNLKSLFPYVKINGNDSQKLPGIINVSFPGIDGEQILNLMDLQGICISTGSACNAGIKSKSHVLAAMGLSDLEIRGSIRISYGKYNTLEDADQIIDALRFVQRKLASS